MSALVWCIFPVVMTFISGVVVGTIIHRSSTDTHREIKRFERYRAALGRQALSRAAAPPPVTGPGDRAR